MVRLLKEYWAALRVGGFIYGVETVVALVEGLLIVLAPLFVLNVLHGTELEASYASAASGLGQAIGSVPLGYVVERLGDRLSIFVSFAVASGIFLAACLIGFPGLWFTVVTILLVGVTLSAYYNSRHSTVATSIPAANLGKAYSLVGGVNRIGRAVSPVMAGVLLPIIGVRLTFAIIGALLLANAVASGIRYAYYTPCWARTCGGDGHRPTAVITEVPLRAVPSDAPPTVALARPDTPGGDGVPCVFDDVGEGGGDADDAQQRDASGDGHCLDDGRADVTSEDCTPSPPSPSPSNDVGGASRSSSPTASAGGVEAEETAPLAPLRPPSMLSVLRMYGAPLAVAQVFVMACGYMRATRRLLLIFTGKALGLTSAQIGAVVSVSFTVDSALFWVSGILIDRFGRVACAVPFILLLAGAFPFIALSSSYHILLGASAFSGAVNAIGSGIMMVMMADVAPTRGRGKFNGVFRMLTLASDGIGALIVGALYQISDMVAVAAAIVVGVSAAVWMVVMIRTPEHVRSFARGAPPEYYEKR